MNDIQFEPPNCNSFSYVPSFLVPREYPEQKTKHISESFNPRDMYNDYLPKIESEEGPVRSAFSVFEEC
jgi:hypothetical protein